MVQTLAKPGKELVDEMTRAKWAVLAKAISQVLAASDYLDSAKKQVVYNKPGILAAPLPRIMPELSAEQAHLLHMAIGICGEAGELLEAVYNSITKDEPLDMENVVEELGDVEFYMEGFRQGTGTTRVESTEGNINKLSERYEGFHYSDQQAQDRADKVGFETPFSQELSSDPIPESTVPSGDSVANINDDGGALIHLQ